MKAYLDQNIWELAVAHLPATDLTAWVNGADVHLCLGTHNVYEFGRCFLDCASRQTVERGRSIFAYLLALEGIYFLRPTEQLIDSDLVFARTGARPLPLLDALNVAATREEMARLSLGFADRAREYVASRETEIAAFNPRYRDSILERNKGVSIPKEFVQLRDDYALRRSLLDVDRLPLLQGLSDELLFSHPERLPFFNSWINAQIYLNYVAVTNPVGPSKKSTSDFRHVIDSGAADCFVTNDRTLARATAVLSPWQTVYDWQRFRGSVDDGTALPEA